MNETAPTAQAEKKLVNPPSQKRTFQDLVNGEDFKKQISLALPKHITPDRFLRVLMTAVIKQPALLQCTQESLFKGIFDCAALGLEIDGRRAHLIPLVNRKKAGSPLEANLWLDYKGIAELVMRSGLVSNIHADIVCENDVFEFDRGELKAHKIDFKKPRGNMYACYAIIRMKDGTEKVEVMGKDDVDRIRASAPGKNAEAWSNHYNEQAKKTVFKRASKWVPLSSEVRDGLDNEIEEQDPLNVTPKPDIASMIGVGTEETPPPDLTKQAEPTEPPKVVVPDRQVALDVLQSMMLDHQIAESSAVKIAVEKGWAPTKTKGLEDIDTVGLDLLRQYFAAAAKANADAVAQTEKPAEEKKKS
jgi:recombination protein RecT